MRTISGSSIVSQRGRCGRINSFTFTHRPFQETMLELNIMNEIAKGILHEKFKSSLDEIRSLTNWLIIIILIIVFTFFQQYFELNNLQKEAINNEKILKQPWDSLKTLYEGTNGYIDRYIQNIEFPWFQLSMAVSVETIRMKKNLDSLSGNNPIFLKTLEDLNTGVITLSYYNADVQKVSSAQKSQKSFNDLDNETLKSLINLFTFSSRINTDSLDSCLEKVKESGRMFTYYSKENEKVGNFNTPEFKKVLSFSELNVPFRTLESEMILKDMRTFGDNRINNQSLSALAKTLDSNHFSNLTEILSKQNLLVSKINSIQTGGFLEIPLIKKPISLSQFIFLGWFINAIIILYFVLTFQKFNIIGIILKQH